MKNLLFPLVFLFFIQISATAQFHVGLKAGLHSIDIASEGIILPNDDGQGIQLNFLESKYGFHFGLFSRLSFLGIYLEPAIIFNSSSVDYSLEDIDSQGPISVIKNETYHNLDIPLMLGLKAGLLRLYGGPVAHLYIDSSSDLVDFPGYEQRFEDAKYGFQAGLGIDLWKLRLDATYEGNLSKFGDHITIDGQAFEFGESASRILFTIGFKL